MSYGKLYVQPAGSGDKVKVIDLKTASGPLLFGWNEGCGIRILRKQVAGEHAQILRDKDGKVWLVCLDEVYHTLVNGELLRDRKELKDQDVISIAGRDFIYEELKGAVHCPSELHHHHLHGRAEMYVAPLEHWTTSHKDESSQISTESEVNDQKLHKIHSPGLPTTNTSQNSTTNPRREKNAQIRCVEVRLQVHKQVEFGSAVWICGSSDTLGNWEKEKAARMQWTEGNIWTLTLDDKAGPFPDQFEYKYMIRLDNETTDGNWELGENRKLTIEKDKWNSELTPFFILQVKDDWEDKGKREISREAFMQERVGETYQEYTMNRESIQSVSTI